VRTIRFYERIGVLPAPQRTPAGYRVYGIEAVSRLRFVRSAQALGLTLAEIGEVLRLREAQGPPCDYVTDLLQNHVEALGARILELSALRDELRARLPPSSGAEPSRCRSDQVCYLIEGDQPAATQIVGTDG